MVRNDHVSIHGKWETYELWSVPISKPTTMQANGILCFYKTRHNHALYHHTFIVSLLVSTLVCANNQGYMLIFPSLTTSLISMHLPKSIAYGTWTSRSRKQGSLFTHSFSPLMSVCIMFPTSDSNIFPILKPQSHTVFAGLVPIMSNLKSYCNLTGKFSVVFSCTSHYIYILIIKTPTLFMPLTF